MGLKKEEVWTKTFVYVVYFAFYFFKFPATYYKIHFKNKYIYPDNYLTTIHSPPTTLGQHHFSLTIHKIIQILNSLWANLIK